jgi:hypothetical protein
MYFHVYSRFETLFFVFKNPAGSYRGSAHRQCNLLLKQTSIVPVVFHGLRNYDSHLLLSALAKMNMTGEVSVVPHNIEQYVSFTVNARFRKVPTDFLCDSDKRATMRLTFIDSFAFMNRSLSELASNLDKHEFNVMRAEIFDNVASDDAWLPLLRRAIRSDEAPDTVFDALIRKGVYPYDYVKSLDVFSETAMPPRQDFFSTLSEKDVSDSDYQHAHRVWELFRVQNLGEFHDVYLATDVLILADLYENFRNTCEDSYGLDPAHYLTTASLSWDACLKITGIQLDSISDPDMHLFFESGIRGGLSQISHRFAKSNNRLAALNEIDFEPDKPNSFIIYLDMNNLYGTAMVKPLPYKDLRWFDDATSCNDIIKLLERYSDEGDEGFVCEVDLDYPTHLHDAHNDLPLAPETRVPPEISPMTELLTKFALGGKLPPSAHTSRKLLAHFLPRRNYIVHASALKFYLQMGMKLVGFHRGIQFKQKAWIEPYIRLNTELRQQATSAFRKDFFKLMNNRFFVVVKSVSLGGCGLQFEKIIVFVWFLTGPLLFFKRYAKFAALF